MKSQTNTGNKYDSLVQGPACRRAPRGDAYIHIYYEYAYASASRDTEDASRHGGRRREARGFAANSCAQIYAGMARCSRRIAGKAALCTLLCLCGLRGGVRTGREATGGGPQLELYLLHATLP
jgi:hypothetical protein